MQETMKVHAKKERENKINNLTQNIYVSLFTFCHGIKKRDNIRYVDKARLFKKFWEDISPFCGATHTPALNFRWHLPWVSKPGWISQICALSSAWNGFLRFTSVATPADLLAATMVSKPFLIHILAGIFRSTGTFFLLMVWSMIQIFLLKTTTYCSYF